MHGPSPFSATVTAQKAGLPAWPNDYSTLDVKFIAIVIRTAKFCIRTQRSELRPLGTWWRVSWEGGVGVVKVYWGVGE